jgi:hypothetical protein
LGLCLVAGSRFGAGLNLASCLNSGESLLLEVLNPIELFLLRDGKKIWEINPPHEILNW